MAKPAYFWRKGLWTLLSLLFLAISGITLLYLYLESQLPNIDSLKTVKLQVPLRIYTQDGLLIEEYGEKRRIPLTYEQIPPILVNALLATEDQRFFDHPGVDVLGLGRAAVRMLKTGTKSQGGSTITMQVARNFFLSRKKTFLRKINEILLAIKIDKELPKEKILELYLNKIYLGNRAYGVGAAAKIYYDKPLKDLNLAEIAMLAGLPQAPSTQNPIANPVAAKKRRDHVLERLLEEKYITQEAYREAVNQPITARYYGTRSEANAPFVAEMIRQSLFDHFGPAAYTKGYKVYTTIKGNLQNTATEKVEANLLAYDKRHGYRGPITNIGPTSALSSKERNAIFAKHPRYNQLIPAIITSVGKTEAHASTSNGLNVVIPWEGLSWARPALRKGWMGKAPVKASQVVTVGDLVYVTQTDNRWKLTQVPKVEGALVAMNPNNGAIEALVGGFNFQKNKFNRVTQSGRQPGSSIKPFIFAAALNKGYTLATLINDAPIVVDDPSQANFWRPNNVNKKFAGPTRLKAALVRSLNLVAIRILDDIGIDYAIDFLTRFGFNKTNLPKGLSLALGSLSISPMELTTAYAIFANGGYRVEPYLIDHITNSDGQILLQAKPTVVCKTCTETTANPANVAPRVIPEDVAFLINSALKDVVQHGTARAARVLNRQDIGGKTGTTNDLVDAWFAGFTPDLVVTTWMGFDTPASLHEYAANLALPLWIDFMKVALKNKPQNEAIQPENVVAVRIDPISGLLAKPEQQNGIIEYFREQEVPLETEAPQQTATQQIQNENVPQSVPQPDEKAKDMKLSERSPDWEPSVVEAEAVEDPEVF